VAVLDPAAAIRRCDREAAPSPLLDEQPRGRQDLGENQAWLADGKKKRGFKNYDFPPAPSKFVAGSRNKSFYFLEMKTRRLQVEHPPDR